MTILVIWVLSNYPLEVKHNVIGGRVELGCYKVMLLGRYKCGEGKNYYSVLIVGSPSRGTSRASIIVHSKWVAELSV